MSAIDWTRKVFRLRKLPCTVANPDEAATFLAGPLGLAPADIVVFSLARTSDVWEVPPSKVATVKLDKTPTNVPRKTTEGQWEIPVPSSTPSRWLLLDTHFDGMTALNDVDSSEHSTDCIAISGLGSHAFGTWQPPGPDKTFMWIRDEIPRSVAGVRAIVYGYESKLAGSQSFQSVNDIALRLIHQLKSVRSLTLPKSIVFLAHSLGGLILKDAIIQMAHSADEGIRSILEVVKGAVMFGVPSLGMQQAHLMAMVGGQANEVLVQDLSRENGTAFMRQRNKQFEGIVFTRKVKVLWAYETEESPTMIQRPDGTWAKDGDPTVLVNPDSATCYFNRHDKTATIPINKDHSNMVKFSRGDANLSSILVSLLELCSLPQAARGLPSVPEVQAQTQTPVPPNSGHVGTDDEADDDDDASTSQPIEYASIPVQGDEMMRRLGNMLKSIDELHRTLDAPDLQARVTEIVDPFPETFGWVFRHSQFSQWLQQGSELFWLHGKPGSGKSTLMKYIVRSDETSQLLHNWRRSSHEIQAHFFFHHRGTAIQKSFEGVLRSLIIQTLSPHRRAFCKQHQKTRDSLLELYRARKAAIVRDKSIRKELSIFKRDVKMRRRAESTRRSTSNVPPDLEHHIRSLERDLIESTGHLDVSNRKIRTLIDNFRPFENAPLTRLLADVIAQYRETDLGLVPMLEKLLRLLIDQNVMNLDLIIFFDALDEFDGNHHMISRFLKGLVQASPTSTTRVKVCFSSRPWEDLKDHFSHYPSISLQEHTKRDVEGFTIGSLAGLRETKPIVDEFIPEILARANGVFLWVKLVVAQLASTIAQHGADTTRAQLRKTLQELPDDLDEFYRLIIRRIAEPNPRRTFALLELLLRHDGPAPTASHVRDAVLVSGSTTLQEAQDELEAVYGDRVSDESTRQKIRNDIASWGGGLVEIKTRAGLDWPQLLHQTVLEFTKSLEFKKLVLSHLAGLVHENGHSFHFKYLLLSNCLAMDSASHGSREHGIPLVPEDRRTKQLLAHHATWSEMNSGKSQIRLISSIRAAHLVSLPAVTNTLRDSCSGVLNFAVSYGLPLCLRDWFQKYPGELGRLSVQDIQLPLVSSIMFQPACGHFRSSHLLMVQDLFRHGFDLQRDVYFYPNLLERLRAVRGGPSDKSPEGISTRSMMTLAALALAHGQDANALSSFFTLGISQCRPLHMATRAVATQLLAYGADPNLRDSKDRTPLDWAVHAPDELLYRYKPPLGSDARFEMCEILTEHGGLAPHRSRAEWAGALEEFDEAGCDTQKLRQALDGILKASALQTSVTGRISLDWLLGR
ncbi:hypothetical protein BN1708_002918 [Verticillium longisporum]|uniref:Nephrocystin 3-like N-terminal domain-containing protein n=1 Tax=Verticillium longisporum TaxID=100787 RepID=A0A0G4L3R7_VERLO|nr:hypothetical protein BN1708_002918 [Verticillium longisporum]